VLLAEMGNVDDGEGIGGLDPEGGAGRHGGEPLARLHHRKRAFQPAQVIGLDFVFRGRPGHFCQNFQKGFFGVCSTTVTAGFSSGTGTVPALSAGFFVAVTVSAMRASLRSCSPSPRGFCPVSCVAVALSLLSVV